MHALAQVGGATMGNNKTATVKMVGTNNSGGRIKWLVCNSLIVQHALGVHSDSLVSEISYISHIGHLCGGLAKPLFLTNKLSTEIRGHP